MPLRRLPHGSRLLTLLALLAALTLAACGGSGAGGQLASDEGPDPASVAPANAIFYGEALVRPGGDVGEGVDAALRKTFRVTDPAAELHRLIDEAADGEANFRYARDIGSWLGQRAGGFVLLPGEGSVSEDDVEGALAVAVEDHAALDDALERLRASADYEDTATYRGVSYDTDGETYVGVVDDLLVVGTLPGLRAAIDASEGSSLADESRFTDALADVDENALASFWFDPQALVEQVGADDLPQEAPANARELLARFRGADPVVASLTVTADEIALDATGDSALLPEPRGDAAGEVTVGQLPGDAWLALATPPLGPAIRDALDQAGLHDQAADEIGAAGFDLDRDLLDPLGALGLFVRGTNPLDIGGGLLLQMTDASAAQRLVTRLQALLGAGLGTPARSVELGGGRGFELQIPQSPQPVVVLAKGDRIAAGYAASSATDLLDPQQRFDESAAGRAAIATLGDGYTPSFAVVVSPIADLLSSLDGLGVADLADVVPYVRAYRSLAAGTKRDGDKTSVRVVAALR